MAASVFTSCGAARLLLRCSLTYLVHIITDAIIIIASLLCLCFYDNSLKGKCAEGHNTKLWQSTS